MLIVALCVALMTLLAGQSATAAIDKAQHGVGLEHAATVSAGLVHLDDGHHDAGTETPDGDAGRHHHHGDGPQTFPLSGEAATALASARPAAHVRAGDAPRGSSMNTGLLRPPKATETDLA